MKNLIKTISLFVCAGVILTSCQKDSFTEEDAMNALQEIELIVTATAANANQMPLGNAAIKIIQNGTAVEKVTDTITGTVIFSNVKIGGDINVYASKEGYTTVVTKINTLTNDYRQATVYQNVALYATDDASLATVSGKLTIESDLTNRSREAVPVGTEVYVKNESILGETSFVGTTDAEGNYSVKVPVSSEGDDLEVFFADIVTSQSLALIQNNKSREVVSRTTSFKPGYYAASKILAVPSAVITIDGPVSIGSGFMVEAVIDSANLYKVIGSSINNVTILQQGSNYFNNRDTTVWANFNIDAAGKDTAQLQLEFEDGKLVGINNYRNRTTTSSRDAKYLAKPTLDLGIGGGTGAKITYPNNFDHDINVTSNGTGYFTLPDVRITYYDNDMKLVADVDMSNATISEGSIYVDGGDILLTTVTNKDDITPTFEVVESNSLYAQIDYQSVIDNLNEDDSTMGGIDLLVSGIGYDKNNPPAITVSSLTYGMGASYRTEVNTDGEVSNIEQIQLGSGYVLNTNDYKGLKKNNDQDGESGDASRSSLLENVFPSTTRTSSVYYGTGQAQEDL